MMRTLIYLLVLLPAYPALHATTIIVPTDEQLVRKSHAIVTGVVEQVEVTDDDGIWTETTIAVDETLKGHVPPRVIVREPGGTIENRRVLIYGSPVFEPGDRVLVFLAELDGSRARVTDMSAGVFSQDDFTGHWRRRGRDAGVRLYNDAEFDAARDARKFPEWIAARAGGVISEIDYDVASTSDRRLDEDFTLLVEPSVYRWKAFERGSTVSWKSTGSQSGYRDGGRDAIRTGISSWSNYAAANIRYRYDGGSTLAPGGMSRANGINEVMFEDPLGEIAGSWNPSTGGVVGIGGFTATVAAGSWTPPFAADPAHGSAPIASTWEIVEGNLVIQDGVAPSREVPEFELGELIAHELGHTLGFGHSADPLALMYFQMTGLGPSLRADDQLAARWLYPAGDVKPPSPPAAPKGLTARAQGPSEVRLDWVDASADETGFAVYMAPEGAGYRPVAQAEANRNWIVIGSLSPGSRYRFVVTATSHAGESAPSNAVEITIEGSQPKPAFGVKPAAGVAGITRFQFTDQSSGPISSREWDFGDGTRSSELSPSHVYATAGTRTVTLTVRSSAGSTASTTRKVVVSSPAEPPKASFRFTPSPAMLIDEIEFIDESTGHVENWHWQFGDDTFSTEQNPKKRYTNAGNYTVTLVVTGQGTQSTATRTITIASSGTGSQSVVAGFEMDPGILVQGREIRFFDRSTGHPNSWYWQFGDGIISTLRNPSHAYTRAGVYSLVFRAGNQESSSATSRTIRVYPQESVLKLIVPAVADAEGGGGSSWRSDLSIFNADPVAHTAQLVLATVDGERHLREVEVAAGETLVWANVIREVFDLSATSGMLMIEAASDGARPDLIVASRTFTRDGVATYGQGVPALTASGSRFTLTGIRSDSSFRTNVGVVNSSHVSRHVVLRALGASGQLVGSTAIQLEVAGFTQRALANLFDSTVAPLVRTIVIEADGDGVLAYASIIDNRTQDPVFIAGVPDDQVNGEQLLPVAASTSGAGGSRWTTDLTLFRVPGAQDALPLGLLPQGATAAAAATVQLADAETRLIPDAMRFITGADGAGAVLMPAGAVVSSRTFTAESNGGTWGQGVGAVRVPSEAPRGVTGLRADNTFRSNIGVANATFDDAAITFELLRRDGSILGVVTKQVGARSLSQWSVASLIPGVSYSGVFSARIVSDVPVVVYASVIDNASGDPAFILAR